MKIGFIKGDIVNDRITGILYEVMMNDDRCVLVSGNSSVNGYAYRWEDHRDNRVFVMPSSMFEDQHVLVKRGPTKTPKVRL